MADPWGVWTAAFMTVAVLSYLYRENSLWRAVEHLYVGLAAGYGVGYVWHNFLRPVLLEALWANGQWSYLFPLSLGFLVYLRYLPRYAWLARIPLAIWVGYGAGYILAYAPRTLVEQVAGSFLPLKSLDNVLVVAALLGSLAYFFFTLPRQHPVLRWASAVGRWSILVALGASFGSAVLYRYNILFGRIAFLLRSALGMGG